MDQSAGLRMFESDTIKLDRINGMNFTRWKEKMKFLLTAFKVYYVLEGPPIGVMTEEEERKHEQDETLCRGYILTHTIVRFGKRGKLNPRYVEPFKVLKKVGAVAYKIELPQEPSRVHNTFQVSNLKKCYSDDPLVNPLEGLQVDDKLYFVEEPVEIMDREYQHWINRMRSAHRIITMS
ncbi:hypothetical protein Tco_1474059 [Tanacetum coccineum]